MKRLFIMLAAVIVLLTPAGASGHGQNHVYLSGSPHWAHYPGEKAKPKYLTHLDDQTFRGQIASVMQDWQLGIGDSNGGSVNVDLHSTPFPPSYQHGSADVECATPLTGCTVQFGWVEMFDYTGCAGNCTTAATTQMNMQFRRDAQGNVIWPSFHFYSGTITLRIDVPNTSTPYKKFQLCHEIMHSIGLGHQGGTHTTCTEAVVDPLGAWSNQPNVHDYDQADLIHNHGDPIEWWPTEGGDPNQHECAKLGYPPPCGPPVPGTVRIVHELKTDGRAVGTLILPGAPTKKVITQFRAYAKHNGLAFKRTLL